MLQNPHILDKNYFLIKNNFFTTNIVIYKITNFILLNIQSITIVFIEKLSIEYFLKNIYINFFQIKNIIVCLMIQTFILVFILI